MKTNQMIVLVVGILVVALLTYGIFFRSKDDETRVIYCGPNQTNPVTIFKNPTRAFPAFVNEYHLNTKASLDLMDSLKNAPPGAVSIDMDYSSKVAQLRDKLNQDNIRMENILKASFYAFNANPCDDQVRQHYLALLDTMTQKTLDLEKFKASITESTHKGGSGDTAKFQLSKDTALLQASIDNFSKDYFNN